jgi:undecaprenol kinase
MQKLWKHKNLKESIFGAFKGLWLVLLSERNARIISLIALLTVGSALLLRFPLNELGIIIVVSLSVFACEMFNTLVEHICDIIKPEDDPHIKVLKDIASGTVLLVCIGAVSIGAILFLPKITALF